MSKTSYYNTLLNKTPSSDSSYRYYKNLAVRIDSASNALKLLQAKEEKKFKPKFDGYIIDHAFRARNSYNAVILQEWEFVLNKNFKVIGAGDKEESKNERERLQEKINELIGNQ